MLFLLLFIPKKYALNVNLHDKNEKIDIEAKR